MHGGDLQGLHQTLPQTLTLTQGPSLAPRSPEVEMTVTPREASFMNSACDSTHM